MGQFDTVIVCVDKLPISLKLKEQLGDKNQIARFQTKDLEVNSNLFEITEDGHLQFNFLNEYFTFKNINVAFTMYTTIGGSRFPKSAWPKQEYKWIEFLVTFEHGKLKSIIFDQNSYDNGKNI